MTPIAARVLTPTLVTTFALAACGGSSSTPSRATGGPTAVRTAVPSANVDSCSDVSAFITEYTALGAQLASTFGPNPGPVEPTVGTFQQTIANADREAGALDGHAPAAVVAPLHALRSALDQFNDQASVAHSLFEINAASTPLTGANVQSAAARTRAYVQTTCGGSPTTTP